MTEARVRIPLGTHTAITAIAGAALLTTWVFFGLYVFVAAGSALLLRQLPRAAVPARP
jgi:hypothetical protein